MEKNPFKPGELSIELSDSARRELGNIPFSETWLLACMVIALDGIYKQGGQGATTATPSDYSGSITAGGTSQQLMPANPNRKWLFVQNLSAFDVFINFGAAAGNGAGSVRIPAGGAYENPPNFCPGTAIQILCANTGAEFTAKQA